MLRDDNYIIAIESEYKAYDVIVSLLNHNNVAFRYLIDNNYLKISPGNVCAFNFVGVITFKDVNICVLPKYFKDHNLSFNQLILDFTTILKVLKKSGYSDSIPDSKNINTNENINLSEIVLADKFLKDYIEYGLFVKRRDTFLINSEGEVNWNSTINNFIPIFSKKYPIYIDTYSSSIITEEFNTITELHKWVVKYCLNKFGRILDYSFSFGEDCINNISELGSIEYIINVIRNELSVTFIDRDIILLKRLLLFIEKIQDKAIESFTIYGTGYFNIIWEKTCKVIFEDESDQFLKHIPLPLWNDMTGKHLAKETFIPDIISISADSSECFFIFDAKYYNISYSINPDFKVHGNPGINDVSKQFLYESAFKKLPYKSKINCFLFPKLNSNFFEVFGFISFALFPESKVYNIFLSPNIVFDSYLNNRLVGKLALNEIDNAIKALDKKTFDTNI